MEEKTRWIDLSELPKYNRNSDKERIDWKNSTGEKVNFNYDGITGCIELGEYNSKTKHINVFYHGTCDEINIGCLLNCQIGRLIGANTNQFKLKIGDIIRDGKRDIVITGMKYETKIFNSKKQNFKYYKYTCNKCGYSEGWIEERILIKREMGCSCCSGRTVVNGINDIPTTDPWMIPYFQGGYDEAKNYTHSSTESFNFKCPDCGEIKKNKIALFTLFRTRSIGCNCSDGKSYPNKFVYAVLKQIKNIQVRTEKKFEWSDNRVYDDFVLAKSKQKIIIENHGSNHYNGKFKSIGGKSQEEEIINDTYKKHLAFQNGYTDENYIELNCMYSNLEWIKTSIVNSRLPKLLEFNTEDIDWNKCDIYAHSSLTRSAWDMWNNGNRNTKDIANKLDVSIGTVQRYLKQGNAINICNYNKYIDTNNRSLKRVYCIELNKTYNYAGLAEKELKIRHISDCCRGHSKSAGKLNDGTPLHWMYHDEYAKLSDEEKEELHNKYGMKEAS